MVRINVLTWEEDREVVFTGKPIGYRWITDPIHPIYLVATIPWDIACIKDDAWYIVPGSESLSLADAAATALHAFGGVKRPRVAAVAVLCVTHANRTTQGQRQCAGTVIEVGGAGFYPKTVDGLPVMSGCDNLSDAMRQYVANMHAVQKDMNWEPVSICESGPADPNADTVELVPELGGES